ncbi:MDR family MFS transporter [Glycomyces algeriensis]|uniref:MFS transporter n=1 Tax=Glycomyces algeriensis TaxID=256037 RepID=A0A9W6GAX7_9ACTN|nr:MDR family MFS transporter [Glycomyces algeriensis]MDA1364642.1 MDR family MFS transporter [Glycomyces algeriensis]MDR7350679.1 DHA2 family lincomycin resistance protein-like MFS transporter [Glycomyces algeriensis]GLI43388.1 MFS transporter [Glycomyces algeriensis]
MTVDQRPAETPEAEAAPAPEPGMSRQIKIVLGVLLVATFVMILNETVMGVALPRLMEQFEITAATVQWLTTGFMLTMAVVIPMTGLILQRFTTRTVFLAAIGLFCAGTLLAGVATVFPVLVVARVIQASGTAVMLPLLMTTVMTFVPAERRGRTMGFITVVIAVAPAIGPTFSGFILNNLTWRWMFLAVLPIAVLALVLGGVLIKNLGETRPVKLDLLSALLSAVAFSGIIYGLSSLGESAAGNHTPIPPYAAVAVGAASLALFVFRQLRLQKRDAALMDLRPFKSRSFTVGIIMLLISMAALFGSLILLPIYLQNVLGLTTLETGLVVLPGGLAMGVSGPFIGRIFDKVGPRPLVIPGSMVLAGALGLMTMLDQNSETWFVVVIHVMLSLGLSSLMTPLMTSSLGALPMELYPHGSAIMSTLQQVAGAVGTAVFITLMTTGAASSLDAGATEVVAQSDGIHLAFLCGTAMALVAVAAAFLVKKAESPSGDAVPVH